MKPIPLWVRLGFVALAYGVALVVAAALLYIRHLQELRYLAEASGGMWAAGDAMLQIFIAFLFTVPTALLVWIIASYESLYKVYSQLLLIVSLSAPVCLGVLTFAENRVAPAAGFLCLDRLLWSPFILLGIGASRLVARFDRAKRLISYALLIEGLTFAVAVALFVHSWLGLKAQ